MDSHRRIAGGALLSLLALGLLASAVAQPAGIEQSAGLVQAPLAAFPGGLPITELSEDEAILHALNRLAFGPRPGDLERVRRQGLEGWIQAQLHPESLADDALDRRLEGFATLRLTPSQLLDRYPPPQEAARRAGLTREQYQARLDARRKAREELETLRERMDEMGALPDAETRRRIRELRERMADLGGLPGDGPPNIVAELLQAKLLRAVHGERQLHEVLTDFWFNHFNVNAAKGPTRWLVTAYERDAIRPHVLGRFRTLLGATAQSPAMLFYLDNWLSADPAAAERVERAMQARRSRLGRGSPQPDRMMRRGLNENYARELLELHTLGVDGGYEQADVGEVARVFTGWTLRAPRQTAAFAFESRLHDPGDKTVLGVTIRGGGRSEGERVLDLLARHPSTARHVATKLARRFVADEPPPALVERMARRFEDTDGDLRAVVETMIYSPEFWARETLRAKVKRPFELVVSTVRALDLDLVNPLPLAQWASRMGEALYLCEPPTGYSDRAEAWVGSGALLHRLNFALEVAEGRTRGARRSGDVPIGGPGGNEALDAAIADLLHGQASEATREALAERVAADPDIRPSTIAGLVLGAPEFQRR